ncbi:hypothetical protein H2O64_10250 [Kordia sp. YSTF-M3]|uniref:Toxin-antitoxin system YwqK family antitoxin n=1 Tax=Kordia aestuariivivens TaxID=2759037 RepID=A0ABR7Q913_9FLAO|nr:hypothetical protein [Kordia aestuariivivens]MBC8755054.1 hypothetical protein [Kordia aestuariivivens]
MKTLCISLLFCCFATVAFSQIDTLQQKMVPMSSTYQKPYKVGSVYYQNNSNKPFTGILYGKFENGNYLTLQEYKNGVGNGTWINYYKNGNLKEVGTYVENRVEGPISEYYENGMLKASGQFKHWRKKVGVWKLYHKDGTFDKTIDYGN